MMNSTFSFQRYGMLLDLDLQIEYAGNVESGYSQCCQTMKKERLLGWHGILITSIIPALACPVFFRVTGSV